MMIGGVANLGTYFVVELIIYMSFRSYRVRVVYYIPGRVKFCCLMWVPLTFKKQTKVRNLAKYLTSDWLHRDGLLQRRPCCVSENRSQRDQQGHGIFVGLCFMWRRQGMYGTCLGAVNQPKHPHMLFGLSHAHIILSFYFSYRE